MVPLCRILCCISAPGLVGTHSKYSIRPVACLCHNVCVQNIFIHALLLLLFIATSWPLNGLSFRHSPRYFLAWVGGVFDAILGLSRCWRRCTLHKYI